MHHYVPLGLRVLCIHVAGAGFCGRGFTIVKCEHHWPQCLSTHGQNNRSTVWSAVLESSVLYIKWEALRKHLCRINATQWVTRLFIGQCLFNCVTMSCRHLERGFSDAITKRVKFCFCGIAKHWCKASEEWFIDDIVSILYLVLACSTYSHLKCIWYMPAILSYQQDSSFTIMIQYYY